MERRLLAVLAHPDDESFGLGGTLARYAAEGVDVHIAIATDGVATEYGDELTHAVYPASHPPGRVVGDQVVVEGGGSRIQAVDAPAVIPRGIAADGVSLHERAGVAGPDSTAVASC